MIKKKFLLILFIILLILVAGVLLLFRLRSSSKSTSIKPLNKTLSKLYKRYKNGQIDQCLYGDQILFVASLNAYDAEGSIYNLKGEKLATCNYAWGNVDKLCEELKKCERIYVIEGNIWGYPPVNKYNLN